MADEQPNTPSVDASTSDAATVPPSSDQPKDESSEKSPGWWQRITRRPSFQGRESRPDGGDEAKADETSSTLSLSQEELDRRVQAETDRREAKRAAEAKAKERKDLRDRDPWAYAEEERKAEEATAHAEASTASIQRFLSGVGTEHDRVAIDPLFELLPQAEKDRILKLEGAGQGLKGRKLVVSESLKALEKQWKADGAREAEAKLRRNGAFRKQVLAEARGSTVEPDLLPAYGSSAADQTVSALLRRHYDLG